MLNEDFNPYDEIIELKKFANQVDKHIVSLLNNQKQFIDAINETSAKVQRLESRLKTIEGVINAYFEDAEKTLRSKNETSRKKR